MLKQTRKIQLASQVGDVVACTVADSFCSRFMGLMGRDRPINGEGLIIRPCNSIHMFFMRFPIDAVFLDRGFRIVKLIRGLSPGKVVGTVPGAWQVLEVAAGSLPSSFREGERLVVRSL